MHKNRLVQLIVTLYCFAVTALPLTGLAFLTPAATGNETASLLARPGHYHHKSHPKRSHSPKTQSSACRRLGAKISHLAHAPKRAWRASKRYLARHHLRHGKTTITQKPRSAYPADFFMWSAPAALSSNDENMPAAPADSAVVSNAFTNATSSKYSPQEHIQAGVFIDEPLRGGIFKRRQPVKYIILHSTETGRPADAVRVIHSWNRGMRHPGAQYMVDRDGTIYQTVDPAFGTVHVDIFRTLGDVNNDNSIGIEIVHTGDQEYTPKQLDNVTRLVAYLQNRFLVADNHILRHGDVQPSDRRDPVNFDWQSFISAKSSLKLKTEVAEQTSSNDIPAATQQTEISKRPEAIVALESESSQQPRHLWLFGLNLAETNFFKTLQEWFRVQL